MWVETIPHQQEVGLLILGTSFSEGVFHFSKDLKSDVTRLRTELDAFGLGEL